MKTTIINIKTEEKTKKDAQKLASDLGFNLSTLINTLLKQAVRSKIIILSLNENNPSNFLLSSIEESKKQREKKEFYSFKNNQEAINFLSKNKKCK